MKLVLLGPPGAGKGTQAAVLSAEFGMPHISTGDILRDAVKEKTKVGLEAKSYMDKGELVPDNIVTNIVVERLAKSDAEKGFILDGFPRTRQQAESLKKELDEKDIGIDRVLYFKTNPSTIISRLSGRRTCHNCNAIYHVKNNPPIVDNICDKCGGRLHQREDDKEETVKKRLEVYQDSISELLDYYDTEGKLCEVSGDLEVDDLFHLLKDIFKKDGLA